MKPTACLAGIPPDFTGRVINFESGTINFEASASVFMAMKNIGLFEKIDFVKLKTRFVSEDFDGIPENYDAYKKMIYSSYPSYKEKLDMAFSDLDKIIGMMGNLDKPLPPFYSGLNKMKHNYASLENHYGKNVWVHRKGAIRAREKDVGIIPGAMGSYSYIVKGLGNPESFHSCSHGAGRKFARTKAKEEFSVDKVISDLKECNVVLGKHKKNDVAEECRFAYKDIDFVIQNELDLVKPIKRLKTIGVVKG